MAGRKLIATVHVEDENGEYHVFGPGDNVPADLAKRITNPAVWESEPEPKAEQSETPRTGRRRTTS